MLLTAIPGLLQLKQLGHSVDKVRVCIIIGTNFMHKIEKDSSHIKNHTNLKMC